MLTQDERRAVLISAMKYGFEEFASLLQVSPQKLLKVLRGEYDFEVEKKIRGHWGLIKELLFGYQKRGDKNER